MNISCSQNVNILAYLTRDTSYLSGKVSHAPMFALWNSVSDPYGFGCHPDVVDGLWFLINSKLPSDCRAIIYGTPALVHPKSGVIFAIAIGTQCGLRLPGELAIEATRIGAQTLVKWSAGGQMDIRQEFGNDWVFTNWSPIELELCRKAYDMLDTTGDPVRKTDEEI